MCLCTNGLGSARGQVGSLAWGERGRLDGQDAPYWLGLGLHCFWTLAGGDGGLSGGNGVCQPRRGKKRTGERERERERERCFNKPFPYALTKFHHYNTPTKPYILPPTKKKLKNSPLTLLKPHSHRLQPDTATPTPQTADKKRRGEEEQEEED